MLRPDAMLDMRLPVSGWMADTGRSLTCIISNLEPGILFVLFSFFVFLLCSFLSVVVGRWLAFSCPFLRSRGASSFSERAQGGLLVFVFLVLVVHPSDLTLTFLPPFPSPLSLPLSLSLSLLQTSFPLSPPEFKFSLKIVFLVCK